MRLRYRAEGGRLLLRVEGDPDDEHRIWKLLATMGCPTQAEQLPGTLHWQRWIPQEQLPRLERAAKLVRAELAPEAGEAVVASATHARAEYQRARPFDPAPLLAGAKADPAASEPQLADAYVRFEAWLRAHPGWAREGGADLEAIGAALQVARVENKRRAALADQEARRADAEQLRGVAGEDAFAAHQALKQLREAVQRAERAAPKRLVRDVPERIAHFRGRLRPYQVEGVRFLLERGLNAILADEMGLGKAQPLDAKVLTPQGWVRMGSLVPGDEVVGSDGKPHRVLGVFPQGLKAVYRVTFSDGAEVECCEDHLWLVNTPLRKSRGNPPKVLSLRELTGALRDGAGNARHFIPLVEPIAYPIRDLPVEPYLLGCLLGDGGLSRQSVYFSSADSEVLAHVEAALPAGVGLRRTTSTGVDYRLTMGRTSRPNPLLDALRSLGAMGHLAHQKRVPSSYLTSSVEQRVALLQGLLDTDGYATVSGGVEYTTTSKGLCGDVAELARSLGGTARRRSKLPSYTHRGERRRGRRAYTLTLALPAQIAPFRLTRKAERCRGRIKYPPTRCIVDVEPVGEKEVQCIRVDAPDQLYVTDDYVLTHNTVETIAAVEAADARAFVVAPANVLYNWKEEVERFTDEPAAVWHQQQLLGPRDARFLITTYDALRNLGDVEADALARPVLVLDEAHYVRNPETLRAQLVRALPHPQRILLTGTPLVNSIEDYYELLRQVEPERWGSRSKFRETWLVDPGLFNKYAQVRNATAMLLQRAARDVLLRRRKDEVLQDLPPRTVSVNIHELPPDRLVEYRQLESRAEETLRREARNELAVFAAIHALRQHLALARVPVVEERLRELLDAGEAVVVYAHYLEPLRQLQRTFGREAMLLEGATPPKERQAMAKRFGQPGRERVLLAQMEAGGIGLNFTAARHVLFVHFGWTPAVHAQAMDRVHRIGQDRPVFVEFFVTPTTIDERMVRILLRKEADQNLVLADESDVLNRNEVARLLAEDAARRVQQLKQASGAQ